MENPKIKQVFFNVSMINGHDGLTRIVKLEQKKVPNEHRVRAEQLNPGELLVFINTQRNKLKILAANGVMAYLKLRSGRLDLQAIQYIPNALQGNTIDYDKALAYRMGKMLSVTKPHQKITVVTEETLRESRTTRTSHQPNQNTALTR